MLPFLKKSQNKMLDTLMDGRGSRTEVSPDKEVKGEDYNHELESACTALLNAIERKSIPDLMQASRDVHQAVDREEHFEGPHTNEESE